MSRESAFIARLRLIARDPAARDLCDDAAVLPLGDRDLVLTHDMLVEGVHYLATDPPEDVAWKLAAVNLSDLAAKGARPLGVVLGYPLARDAAWDLAFADGLEAVLGRYGVPLLGGDTVRPPPDAPRMPGLTAIGDVPPGGAPARSGARNGDHLWVTGRIGAAGLGLAIAQGRLEGSAALLQAYRRPEPRLAEGQVLAPLAHAMADVSDGLLIDARRMAEASGLMVEIHLDRLPCHPAVPPDRRARLAAATAGDDYELLFAAAPGTILPPLATPLTRIGRLVMGHGIVLRDRGDQVPLPQRLGYEH